MSGFWGSGPPADAGFNVWQAGSCSSFTDWLWRQVRLRSTTQGQHFMDDLLVESIILS
jgi:hypothetical protein